MPPNNGACEQNSSDPASVMAQVNDRRWVVAFAGARDSYQVPIALHESGLLQSLVTDFYAPFDQVSFAQASKLLPSSICTKLGKRFDSALPSRFVQSDFGYAIRNWWDPEGWMHRVGSLGARAGQIAATERCSIFAYAHVATSAFSAAPCGHRGPTRSPNASSAPCAANASTIS